MTRTAQDFEMWSGDTKNLLITVSGSDGSGYDATGASVSWVVAQSPTSASLVRKTTACSITISTSKITIPLTAEDTESLNGLYYHEAEMIDTLGNVSTITVGTIRIHRSIA